MKIIEKIEIKSFRSFGNRKKSKTQIQKIEDLNIFSGANDSGKSNILRALNLFFNKRTNLDDFLEFNNDFFKRENSDADDIKEELITIKITFWNEKNKGRNAKNKTEIRLPERFWVSRKWLKKSEFSSYQQADGVQTAFKTEKKANWRDFYESGEKALKSNVQANLYKQLTGFFDSIQYHYVPAIKDKSYFSHLYGELQQTLLKEENSNLNKHKGSFQEAIQKSTEDLMDEFKKVINNEKLNISAAFELPDLINLFRTLNVQTGKVNLLYRGDGVQAKLIPEILNFIALKELQMKPSKLRKGEKTKKYFIWGFEEPENSYEYKNAQLLANRFKDVFTDHAQIFLTTHSFNFLSIEGKNVSLYRVWKDEESESSKITKIKKIKGGKFDFEGNDFDDDSDRLKEELGVFQLNQDLEKLYNEVEDRKKKLLESEIKLKEKFSAIIKPILISEGKNKVYLGKAKNFLLPQLNCEIFNQKEFGDKEMLKLFKFLLKTQNKEPKKVFILDCDAVSTFKSMQLIETDFLIPFIFKKNEENTKIKKGIENLFSIELCTSEMYSKKTVTDDYGAVTTIEDFNKNKFEKHVCSERDEKNDFLNFKPLFEMLDDVLDSEEGEQDENKI